MNSVEVTLFSICVLIFSGIHLLAGLSILFLARRQYRRRVDTIEKQIEETPKLAQNPLYRFGIRFARWAGFSQSARFAFIALAVCLILISLFLASFVMFPPKLVTEAPNL